MIDILSNSRIPPFRVASWRDANRLFLTTFAGILTAIYLFILLVDPYGVVPFSPPFHRPVMSSQRQAYPQIIRTGRYDSIVLGTSTSRLLDPVALNRVLGGHFASLAMPATTAWEQIRILEFFLRKVAAPNAVVIGLDHEWCYRGANAFIRNIASARENEFPFWAYDDNPWNDLLYLLNDPTLEVSGRVIGRILGWVPQKLRDDGFEVFVPPESTYDLSRARAHIWGPGGPRPLDPVRPAVQLSAAERQAMNFEALPWLDESLAAMPAATKKVLLFPPVHVGSLPAPGSYGEAHQEECKSRVAAVARKRGALLVDWQLVSPLTTEDSNFWDPLHYRLPIAYRLIDDLDHVIREGRTSPDGSYRILVR